jgi:hypothetical protein
MEMSTQWALAPFLRLRTGFHVYFLFVSLFLYMARSVGRSRLIVDLGLSNLELIIVLFVTPKVEARLLFLITLIALLRPLKFKTW